MKFPKELQRKKKNSNQTSLKSEIIKSFRIEFVRLKRKFKDKRNLKIIDNSNNTDLLEAPVGKSVVKNFWQETEIELVINQSSIIDMIDNVKSYLNAQELKELFKHIARHEYGHTLSYSSYRDTDPIEMRTVETRNMTLSEMRDIYSKTKFRNLDASLRNISLRGIKEGFQEFIANYMWYNKIDKKENYLKTRVLPDLAIQWVPIL